MNKFLDEWIESNKDYRFIQPKDIWLDYIMPSMLVIGTIGWIYILGYFLFNLIF